MYNYNYSEDYLIHYGVKGMKWGVRRASKAYKKEMIKYQKDAVRSAQALNLKAYNKTADEYNNGKIEAFNKTHDPKSKTYMEDYAKQFERDYRKNFDRMKLSEMENNKHYKKAKKICDKYNLTSYDELAQKNEKIIRELKQNMRNDKTSWDIDGVSGTGRTNVYVSQEQGKHKTSR